MKKSNQLHLSPATSLQSLSAKARRAAALSLVERQLNKPNREERPKRPQKGQSLPPIQLSARSIFGYITARMAKGTTMIKETPGRYSSAHAIFSIYNDADIEAQRIAKELRKTDPNVKIPRLCPVIRYVLYASVLNPTQLGSVAIYCENVRTLNDTITRSGYIFGMPVKRTALETGMCQYIDVVFRP